MRKIIAKHCDIDLFGLIILYHFSFTLMSDIPHRVEVEVTPTGLARDHVPNAITRAYYTPVLENPHFMHRSLTIDGLAAELESFAGSDESPLNSGHQHWEQPLEFLATTQPQKL